jgi:hypothetical protein
VTIDDLLPAQRRAERRLLLDLLAGRTSTARFGAGVDAEDFLAVTPETLYALAYRRLQASPQLDAPPWLIDRLEPHYRGNVLVRMRRRALLRALQQRFDDAGVEHLLLKGPVIAETVYEDPATRTMSDLDFLVRADQMAAATAVLDRAGFRVPTRYRDVDLPPGDAAPYEAPEAPETMIELHSVLDSTGVDDAEIAAAWSRSSTIDLGGINVQTLGVTDFFSAVAAHLSKHHRFEGMLRALLDVALLLQTGVDAIDWTLARAQWERSRTTRWISLTVSLAHRLLGAPLPPRFEVEEGELLTIAAAQLWQTSSERIPPRVLLTLAGMSASPIHAGVPNARSPMTRGLRRVGVRAAKLGGSVRRVAAAFRNGAFRLPNVKNSVRLFRERERLVALIESEPRAE